MDKIKVYTVRIVYKSGYTHDFDVTAFSIKSGSYSWAEFDVCNQAIMLGTDEIAAVWQVGMREVEKPCE